MLIKNKIFILIVGGYLFVPKNLQNCFGHQNMKFERDGNRSSATWYLVIVVRSWSSVMEQLYFHIYTSGNFSGSSSCACFSGLISGSVSKFANNENSRSSLGTWVLRKGI